MAWFSSLLEQRAFLHCPQSLRRTGALSPGTTAPSSTPQVRHVRLGSSFGEDIAAPPLLSEDPRGRDDPPASAFLCFPELTWPPPFDTAAAAAAEPPAAAALSAARNSTAHVVFGRDSAISSGVVCPD